MNLFTVDLESFEYSRPAHSPLSLSFIWSLLLACKTCNYESLCCIYWPLSCSNTKVFSVQRQSQHKRAATQRLGLLGFTFHQTGAVTYHSVCTSLYIIYIASLQPPTKSSSGLCGFLFQGFIFTALFKFSMQYSLHHGDSHDAMSISSSVTFSLTMS